VEGVVMGRMWKVLLWEECGRCCYGKDVEGVVVEDDIIEDFKI
jgi:hypothetical protein